MKTAFFFMKLRNGIIYTLSLSIFIVGCQRLDERMKMGPDTPVSISAEEDTPEEIFYSGTVFMGEAGDRFGTDEYTLNSVSITGDTLNVSVSYSGGCEIHQFTLVVSDTFLESFPVQLHAYLAHNANGDTCEGYPTDNYRFNLTPIKTLYQNAYRQEAGTIVLHLRDAPEGNLIYEFTM